MKCEELAEIFKENELTFFTGVPDSTFKEWISFLSDGNGFDSITSVNECEAAANCAGYHLSTGKLGVLYMQNSGLGKVVNPHTSLLAKEVYSIPALFMIGWRGEPGEKDEPQHKMMGRIMLPLLDVLEVPYEILPAETEQARKVIKRMKQIAEQNNSPAAIIIKKGNLEEYAAKNLYKRDYEMSREDAIRIIVNNIGSLDSIISTTGKTSRELFECRISRNEKPRDFYTVGSMGCSASIANILAIKKPGRKIFVFDGDGAALMQLGALATIGNYKARNLYHIIFDNASYESTGGQPTFSPSIDFEKIALACGYKLSKTVETKTALVNALSDIKKSEGPAMLVVKINMNSRKELGRPTSTAEENKKSFMEFLKD